MKTVLDIIKPIKLLSGSHPNTGTTGQGCAMNVIAYLNGEDQITDDSPCVCVTVRSPLIWFNDFLHDDERQELVPYLLRAMGSSTKDRNIIAKRLVHLVKMANIMADVAKRAGVSGAVNETSAADYVTHAASAAASAANNAAHYAAANAVYAASNAVFASVNAATYAAYAAYRAEIKAAGFVFLDAVLPKTETHGNKVFGRAKNLAKIAELV